MSDRLNGKTNKKIPSPTDILIAVGHGFSMFSDSCRISDSSFDTLTSLILKEVLKKNKRKNAVEVILSSLKN